MGEAGICDAVHNEAPTRTNVTARLDPTHAEGVLRTLPALQRLLGDALAAQEEAETEAGTPAPLPDGVTCDGVSGYCPVQAEGTVDGLPFYFRARHAQWSFDVYRNACVAGVEDEGWRDDWSYGEPYAGASWMTRAAAHRCIAKAVGLFRQQTEATDASYGAALGNH